MTESSTIEIKSVDRADSGLQTSIDECEQWAKDQHEQHCNTLPPAEQKAYRLVNLMDDIDSATDKFQPSTHENYLECTEYVYDLAHSRLDVVPAEEIRDNAHYPNTVQACTEHVWRLLRDIAVARVHIDCSSVMGCRVLLDYADMKVTKMDHDLREYWKDGCRDLDFEKLNRPPVD